MEIFTTKVKTNLNGVLQMTQMIEGIMMTGDNAANEILVELYRGIDRIDIDNDPTTTKIVGYFIRSDGETIEVEGSVEDNMAKVVIPEVAYQVSGSLSIAIRMMNDPYTAQYRGYYDSETEEFVQVTDPEVTEGPHGEEIIIKSYQAWGTKIVIAALNCFVQLTETDSIIDPYHHIPDVQELLAYIATLDQRQYQINQAEQSRVDAELAREQAEKGPNLDGQGGRVKAEADRVTAEQNRQLNYNQKMSEWAQDESDRTTTFTQNEATRAQTFSDNESDRVTTFTQNEDNRVQTFSNNEDARQSAFEQAEQTREGNETIRGQNEEARAAAELAREKAEKGPNLDGQGGRVKAEADREAAQAVRNALVDGLDAEISQLPAYSDPQVVTTVVDGHKHLHFKLAPGNPFVIAKIFSTITEMENYSGTDLHVGQFVIISSVNGVEDPDNAKMYVVTAAKPDSEDNTFAFVTDLSGAQGIQGPTGERGIGIASISVDPSSYELTVTYDDASMPSYTSGSIRGQAGRGISSVAVDPNTYELTVNYDDGTPSYTSGSIRGEAGRGIFSVYVDPITYELVVNYDDGSTPYASASIRGATGNGIQSAVMNPDYSMTLTWTDGNTFQTPPLRGEPGMGGTNFTYNSTDKHLNIEFY